MTGTDVARGRWQVVVAGSLLALYVFLALAAARQESNTFDEGLHLTSGYLHWTQRDEKLWPENGVFAQAWATLPLLLTHLNPPAKGLPARDMEQFTQGYQFLYRSDNNPAQMLFWSRAMISLLGAATGAVIFLWSRELFGATGALISLFLFVLCPTMLANGALVTTDMAATLGFLVAIRCFWTLTHSVDIRHLLLSLMALGCLVLTKMSFFLIAPVFALVLAVRVFSSRSVELRFPRARKVAGRGSKAAVLTALVVLHGLLVFGVLWLAYNFQYNDWGEEAVRRKALQAADFSLWKDGGLRIYSLDLLQRSRLLPRAFVEGLSYTLDAANRGGFAWGRYSETGRWWFFPFAFLIKTPIATLALFALSLAACVRFKSAAREADRAEGSAPAVPSVYDLAPLLIFGAVFGGACLTSNINIGIRHLMPIYPVLFIFAGANALWLRNTKPIVIGALAALLAAVGVESFSIRPHYLAFFNLFVGGPRNGYHYLIDSSLDWGQDLPGLRQWLDRNVPADDATPLYLAYFGTSDPDYYGIKCLRLPDRFGPVAVRPFPLRGGTYCISASSLQAAYWTREEDDQYWQARRDLARLAATAGDPIARMELVQQLGRSYWDDRVLTFEKLRCIRLCAYLRRLQPDAMVGYSIMIYRLSETTVDSVLYVEPSS